MGDLTGNAQRVRQVVGADEDAVEVWRLEDLSKGRDPARPLDHQQHSNLAIRLRVPFLPAVISGCTHERVGAAVPVRRKAGGANGAIRLGRRTDLRHNDPGRARIEARTDPARIAASHPHDRVDAVGPRRKDQRRQGLVAVRAMLGVEHDAVEPSRRNELDDLHRGDDRKRREERLPVPQALGERWR